MSDAVVARDTAAVPARTAGPRLSARRLALAAGALAVLAGGAWFGQDWWTRGRFIETTDDAYVGGHITAIAPHVSGFVARLLVTDNQRVQAGQLLLQLDERDFRTALDHAQATQAARVASLESLHAQYALQQTAIDQQAAELAARNAQASFAALDSARYRSLAASGAGTKQEADRSRTLDQQARSNVAAATAALAAARQKLDVLRAQIAEAAASVAQAQADLETARLNLQYTEIRSPVDGYVGNRSAEVGAYVTQGTYLISVIPAAGLWVDANFKEDQLARMRAGEPVSITADVLPGHRFRGHVASLAPGTGAVFSIIPPENATGNFTKIVQRVPVRVLLDDGDEMQHLLRPGLSTLVSVDTRANADDVP